MGCSGAKAIFSIFLHVKVEPKQQVSCDLENAVIHNLEKSIANSINFQNLKVVAEWWEDKSTPNPTTSKDSITGDISRYAV